MDGIKLFIADNDIALTGELYEHMSLQEDFDVIGMVSDGKSCLDAVGLLSADVLILSDILPEIDGLSLLMELKKQSRTPSVVILLASFPTRYVKEQAAEHGAHLILAQGTEPARFTDYIRNLVFAQKNQEDFQWRRKVRHQLESYGIPTHLGGFQYLCEVLEMISANENLLHALQSDVFQSISEKYNTSPMSIERRIHYAIQVAWYKKPTSNRMKADFGSELPPVKSFIGYLSSSIK